MYRVGEGDNNDVLIATGITTTEPDGEWTSVGSDIQFKDGSMDKYKYYETLSDGLPPGSYYFKETGSLPGSVPKDVIKEFTITQDASELHPQGDHEQTAFLWIENNKFAASVLVPKYDSTDGSGIEGAEFKIEYWENGEGSTDGQYESFTSTTNSSGMLLLGSLKQGFYRITEVAAAPGYVMGKKPFSATFQIEDGDHEKQFDLRNSDDCDAINFAPDEGVEFVDGEGIPNSRVSYPSSGVELAKVDESGELLNGAEFGPPSGGPIFIECKRRVRLLHASELFEARPS